MIKKLQGFFLFFLLMLPGIAQHNHYILQAPRSSYSNLNTYLEVLKTSNADLSLKKVRKAPYQERFQPYDSVSDSFTPNGYYWGRIKLSNSLGQAFNGMLILGGKRDADFADIYIIDQRVSHKRAGYLVPASKKEVNETLGAKCLLTLKPGESKTLYLRIHNETGFRPDFDLRLETAKTFNDKVQSRNWLQGMLHGFLWLMLLYNILLYIMSRDRTYLAYSLYILGVALNFLTEKGILLENVLKNAPALNDYLFVIATGILSVFYIQFFRRFLDTKAILPGWDKAHRIVIVIKTAEIIFLMGLMLVSYNVPAMISISNISNLLLLGYGLAFIYGLLRYSRSRLAYYFTIATFSLVAGTFISLYFLMFDHSLGFDPKYFMNAGTVGELLFFSLGLGYKIRKNEEVKREYQDKLIRQLKQNEELQTKVNRELEAKVKERTREIMQQKEEISAQSEKLSEVNKELEKLSIVASETDNAVMIMDKKGKIQWVNEGLQRMFGYTLTELLTRGETIFDVLFITDISATYEQVINRRQTVSHELPFVRKDNTQIWVQTTLTPILDEESEIRKLIAIGSDITKIKEAETKITRQRDKISKQNKEITDSINYARRIQTAIMPDHSILENSFSDYFIFFRPRDIVSGDFYWFKEIGKYVVLVSADCTGHGVPGAFMSMLSVAYLNDVVQPESVPRADKILEALREQIKKSLRQTGTAYESKDGIDIAFNVYDKEEQKLYFSGAHTPLYLMRDGQIDIYKGDRMPVGISRKERPFSIHEIQLKKGDTLYLFSDGYTDQFGKNNKEKYKAVRFRELIMSMYHEPMHIQEKRVRDNFFKWKGQTRQIDDVLVMGIKI